LVRVVFGASRRADVGHRIAERAEVAVKWAAWAARKRWPRHIPLDHDLSIPLDRRLPPYAECQGPDDPCCGRCRFSVHGCNDHGPSRAEYIEDLLRG
jgi:hypothetical protein